TGPSGAVVTWPAPAATDSTGASVPVICSPASGSTFAVGTTTVTCTAADGSGNRASSSFTVTVTGAPGQLSALIALINGWVSSGALDKGTGNSLVAKLQATNQALSAGNTSQACSTLQAFLNEVNAQSGKHLTSAQAQQLLSAAGRIRSVLSC